MLGEANGKATAVPQDVAVCAPDYSSISWRKALTELLKAFNYARAARCNPWEFAVDIHTLRAVGLTESDFRWLLHMGYLAHAREITRLEDSGRTFRPVSHSLFSRRTCFVLTEEGALFGKAASGDGPQRCKHDALTCAQQLKMLGPVWDATRQELRVNGLLVKQFKSPAANQETVLAAFQEEGWPPRIDDPLPPHSLLDPKRRLHDTIKCLNRNQKHPLIHFRGDGRGEGVLWDSTDTQVESWRRTQ